MPSPAESNHPTVVPLARDSEGRALDVPECAAAWRVRRHTRGRPRIVLGVDKQPMQLPLSYTVADLEDILSPGAYRLDLIDVKGGPLDFTVAIELGEYRNAGALIVSEEPEASTIHPILATTGSDTRFVLEANVRSTQMAFQHNAKTLEFGLRMAETLRDGVKVLADAQADWLKGLASSKGFFRHAAAPMLPAPGAANDDQEEEQVEDVETEQPPSLLKQFEPMIAAVVTQVITSLMSGSSSGSGGLKETLKDALDWQKAAAKGKAEREVIDVPSVTPETMELPPFSPTEMAHFIAIQSALDREEAALAREVAAQLSPQELRGWFTELKQLAVPDAVAKIRALVTKKPAA
ncbi:MAG: hypothetical protein WKG01_15140 [Kofleriaceae bacterium]